MTEDFLIGSNKRPTRSQLLVHAESVSHLPAADDSLVCNGPTRPILNKKVAQPAWHQGQGAQVQQLFRLPLPQNTYDLKFLL